MNKLDFLKGWKTVSGLIILAVSLFTQMKGIEIDTDLLNETVAMVGVALGAIVAAYGLIMKLLRK